VVDLPSRNDAAVRGAFDAKAQRGEAATKEAGDSL